MNTNMLQAVIQTVQNRGESGHFGLVCTESWNGFHVGQIYHAYVDGSGAGRRLRAADSDGIPTTIDRAAASRFEPEEPISLVPPTVPAIHPVHMIGRLTDAFNILTTNDTAFQPGDIVTWKPGMKTSNLDGPFIVTRVLDEPVFGSARYDDHGSAFFREPLDIVVGVLRNELLVEHHLYSRRLQPVRRAGDGE